MNKNLIITLCILLTVSLMMNLSTPIKMLFVSRFGHNSIFHETIIKDEKNALAYGLLIFNAVYGEDYAADKKYFEETGWHPSYRVSYDKLYRVWRVAGSIPDGSLGSVAGVVFEKNGRVLRVTH